MSLSRVPWGSSASLQTPTRSHLCGDDGSLSANWQLCKLNNFSFFLLLLQTQRRCHQLTLHITLEVNVVSAFDAPNSILVVSSSHFKWRHEHPSTPANLGQLEKIMLPTYSKGFPRFSLSGVHPWPALLSPLYYLIACVLISCFLWVLWRLLLWQHEHTAEQHGRKKVLNRAHLKQRRKSHPCHLVYRSEQARGREKSLRTYQILCSCDTSAVEKKLRNNKLFQIIVLLPFSAFVLYFELGTLILQ